MAEKTFQTYFFTTHNPGGHSSRPRPDNAIYDLADALEKLRTHRFQPMQNAITRGYFEERARQEGNSPLGQQIRAWLANPNDGAAADAIEANPLEVGLTRTRCVATMLKGGHADNALAAKRARRRSIAGSSRASSRRTSRPSCRRWPGPRSRSTPDPDYIGSRPPPRRRAPTCVDAVKAAALRFHGPDMHVFPVMSTGASDGSFFRAQGIPVYDVDGSWGISPDDERAHGLDERLPVRAMYDDVLHWEMIMRSLAGPGGRRLCRRQLPRSLQHLLSVVRDLHLAPRLEDAAVGADQIGRALHPHIFAAVHRLLDPGAERVGNAPVLVGDERHGEVIFADELFVASSSGRARRRRP